MENLNIKTLLEKYLEIVKFETQLGFKPTEIRHLLGRIGEFYCALKSDGRLATQSNQRGYDVISGDGRKISVKTTAQQTGFISFNINTLSLTDDIMIVHFSITDGLQELFYGTSESIIPYCRVWKNNYELDLSKIKKIQN